MRFKYYLRGAGIGVITATLILSIAFLFYDNISDEEVIRRAMKLGMVMQETNAGTLADSPRSDASLADSENGTGSEGGTKTDTDPLAEPDQTGTDPSEADPSGKSDDPSASNADQTGQDGNTDPSGQQDGNADSQGSGKSDGSSPENKEEDGTQQSGGKTNEKEDPDQEGSKDNQKDKADSKPSGSKSDNDADKPSDNKQDAQSDEVEIIVDSGDVSRMVSAKVFEAGLVDDAAEFNDYLGANDYDNMLQPGTYKIKKGSSFGEIARILTRQ